MSKEMIGVCAFCGQTRAVLAQTQEEANEMASLDCGCPGGEAERKRKELRDRLDELIGELAPEFGWDPTTPEIFDEIAAIANSVADGRIGSAAFSIDGTNLKIRRNTKGIAIERSKTIRQGGSIEK